MKLKNLFYHYNGLILLLVIHMTLLVLGLIVVYVLLVTLYSHIRQVHLLDADLQCHFIMHIILHYIIFSWHCKVNNNNNVRWTDEKLQPSGKYET